VSGSMLFLSDLKIPQLFAHSSSSLLAVRDALRSVPDENGALSSNTHNEPLIGRNLNLYFEIMLNSN